MLHFVEGVARLAGRVRRPQHPVEEHAAWLDGVALLLLLLPAGSGELWWKQIAKHLQCNRCGSLGARPEVAGLAPASGQVGVDVPDVALDELHVPLVDRVLRVSAHEDGEDSLLLGHERRHQPVGVVQLARIAHHPVVESVDVLRCQQVQLAVTMQDLWKDVSDGGLPLAFSKTKDETPAHLVVGQGVHAEESVRKRRLHVVLQGASLPLN
mmetsp:Transcript_70463/g.210102  ORF Transcript_70463/g.210102 Transcript_70463/m.210102 type:complete len:211 (-) Transcript_70463:272-904(-)